MTISDCNLLLFQVGPVSCCMDSNSVRMIIEPPAHITAIPGSNAYRPGLFIYANRTVAVYDVRTKFNLPTGQRGKIIITEVDKRLFGFWVDKIQEVILSSQGKWKILPPGCPKELFEAVFMFNKQLIFKTSFDALAKAQVNTHLKQFIEKLTGEEEKINRNEDSISYDKNKLMLKKTITNDQAKILSDTTVSNSTVEQKHLAQDQIKKTGPQSGDKDKTISGTTPDLFSVKQNHEHKTRQINRLVDKEITKPATPIKAHTSIPSVIKSVSLKQTRHEKNAISSHLPKEKNNDNIGLSAQAYTDKGKHDRFQNSTQQNCTTNNQAPLSTDQDETDNTQRVPLISGIVLLLILIIAVPGLTWFLFFDSTPTSIAKITAEKKQIHRTRNDMETTQKQEPTLSPFTSAAPPGTDIEEQVSDKQENENAEITKLNDKARLRKINIEEKVDLTSISYQDDTITITINDIDAELIEPDSKEPAEQISSTINTQDEKLESNTIQEEILENRKAVSISIEAENTEAERIEDPVTTKAVPSITTHRVVHIIVKGDTLWHIARRYINDPFKYPQLARLSKIKNPDLIYPGNKVIIIIKKAQD